MRVQDGRSLLDEEGFCNGGAYEMWDEMERLDGEKLRKGLIGTAV